MSAQAYLGRPSIRRVAANAGAGYLRDLGWPHGGVIDIVQGENMG